MGKENEIQPNPERTQPVFRVIKPGKEHVDYAITISEWTTKAGNMLPKKTEEILGFFEQGHSVLVFTEQNELMSHAAATYIYGDGSIEIGAVFTAEEYRGKGAATHAVKEIIALLKQKYPKQKLFALANPLSAKMFEKMGASKMEANELSSEVWEPCAICPKNPNTNMQGGVIFHCCDTPYNLTNVEEKHGDT